MNYQKIISSITDVLGKSARDLEGRPIPAPEWKIEMLAHLERLAGQFGCTASLIDPHQCLIDQVWLEYWESGAAISGRKHLSRAVTSIGSCCDLDPDRILDRFEMLMIVRAGLHVMLFQGRDETSIDEILKTMRDTEENFSDRSRRDLYLLCGYDKTTGLFRFEKIGHKKPGIRTEK